MVQLHRHFGSWPIDGFTALSEEYVALSGTGKCNTGVWCGHAAKGIGGRACTVAIVFKPYSGNAAEALAKRCERHCRRSVFLLMVVALASGTAAGATGKHQIALAFAELLSATRPIGAAVCVLLVCGRERHRGYVEAGRGYHEPPVDGGIIFGERRVSPDQCVGYSGLRR